jgi:hypothetical protein
MYVTLSKYYFEKCAKFADEQLETSRDMYRYRGEHREHKMRTDIILGKLGEVAAYKYLTARGFWCNKPDFTIYERRRKSYDADLTTRCGKRIHVKAQGYDSMMRYGASWLMQKTDKLVSEPDFEDYILMVSLKGMEANILGVVKATELVYNDLYDEPKVSRYAETKKALYYDTVKCSGISLEAI